MSHFTLTDICLPHKEVGLTTEMVLQGLIDAGLMENRNRITEKGLSVGIEYCKNESGDIRYPLYPADIKTLVDTNTQWFVVTYAKLREKTNTEKSNTQSETETTEMSNVTTEYKYLQLEEFVVLDTETTGLTNADEVVEVAVTDMHGNPLYSQRFMPTKEVDPGAMRVNHLSKRVLAGNPQFSATEWENIKVAIAGRKVLGHNISFDKRLISQTLKRYGITDDTDIVFTGMYDSKDIAKKWLVAKSYSLNNLTTQIGIVREEQHEAADDCRMTVEFLKRLEDIIKIKKEYDFVKC